MSEPRKVLLGLNGDGEAVHDLPVYEQRQGKLLNRIGRFYDAIGALVNSEDGGVDGAAVVNALGPKLYEALCVFIPNLAQRMPEYEFWGYGSAEAYKVGREAYDENLDRSPSLPQLWLAFEVAFEVNGGPKFVGILKSVVDPKVMRAEVSALLSEGADRLRERLSEASPNSLTTPTESSRPDSTPPKPTSDGPSPSETAGEDGERSGSLQTTSA